MEAFSWIGQIFDSLLQLFPRRVIIRATEAGVKWSLWREPKEMIPGIRFYWPLITDIEVIAVARQTLNTPTQSLMTRDGKTVVAGGVVVYKISNIVQAIGKQNCNPEDTVGDITKAAIVDIVSKWTCDCLLANISGSVEQQLTEVSKKQLRQYGIYVSRAAFDNFSIVKQLNHTGINMEG